MVQFTGTWTLIKLALRRDRWRIPVWVVSIVGLTILIAASFPEIYANTEERQARAALITSPAAVAFAGPGHGAEDYTYGAMMTNEMLGFTAIAVALMSVLLVVRHTRAEESSGSMELVRANVVGRYAQLTAALKVVAGVNVVIALLTGVGIGILNIESMGWASSLLYGAALGAVGLVFGAIAAITAQLTEHSRTAAGLAGAAIAFFYSLRAVGDIGNEALSWWSPFGLAQATKAYVDDTWLPVFLMIFITAVLGLVAFALSSQRDVGAGFIAARRGRKSASLALSAGALGLAWRLQRMSILWWTIGLLAFGALYGSIISEVENFIDTLSFGESLISAVQSDALLSSFLALIFSILAMTCAVYTILTVAKLRNEEVAGRAEPVLATAVSRTRWTASHMVVACIGSSVLLVASALGFGLSAGAASGDMSIVTDLLYTAVAYVPALWLVGGISFALFGLLPRAMPAVWLLVAYSFFVVVFAGLFSLPEWMNYLTPFGHVPLLPAEKFELAPLLWLIGISAVLFIIGFVGFRRRDIGAA